MGALLWAQLRESFLALTCGYSTRTLFSSLPGHPAVIAIALLLLAIGLAAVGWRLARKEGGTLALFAATMLPFPVFYGITYAAMGNAVPKPQYLLIGAVAVFGCMGLALDGIRRRLAAFDPRGWSTAAFLIGLGAIATPMARASIARLEAIDKRDWRGVMGHLRAHSKPGDAFAVIAADTVPASYHAAAFGRVWYGLAEVKFLRVGQNSGLADLRMPVWQAADNTVWVLVYTDRMYTGIDRIVPPKAEGSAAVHAFHGLFLIELPRGTAAAERLMDAIELLYQSTPPRSSLVWPGMLRAAYLDEHGDSAGADRSFEVAVRQCRNEPEADLLRQLRSSQRE
jgi:hypothetical protein